MGKTRIPGASFLLLSLRARQLKTLLTCDEDGALVGLEVVDVLGHVVLQVADGALADEVVQHVVVERLQRLERVLEDLAELLAPRLVILSQGRDDLFRLWRHGEGGETGATTIHRLLGQKDHSFKGSPESCS